jgi:short-subunit dehydrogenase
MRRAWAGKHVLITGASQGIGRAVALAFANKGAHLHLIARNVDALRKVQDQVRMQRSSAEIYPGDVAKTEALVAQLRAIDHACGGLDLVIANAGVGAADQKVAPYVWENIRDAFHTNFCGAAATLTAVLPEMVRRKRGHLAFIGSISSYGALPAASAYCSPKAGIDMLLECLRLDLQDTGVAVTNVRLGFVATDMTKDAQHPMPMMMSPESVGTQLVKQLAHAPGEIVLPKLLGLGAQAASFLPSKLKGMSLKRLQKL